MSLPPQEPPRIKTTQLWFSLLSPIGTTLIIFLIMTVYPPTGGFFLILISIITVLCRIWFATIIQERYKGDSACLLIIAYPLAQLIICGTALFLGCLAFLSY